MAELVGAFNELTERMGEELATSSSSRLLFRALKLALPALRDGDGGRALARALAVAASDLQLQVLYLILAPFLSSILVYKSVFPVI